jgi:mannose-1-phosphate guanylyltransferase
MTMGIMRYAVIMAGGGGTRLWPASRRDRPKQLLSLGTGDEPLLAATARRVEAVGARDRIVVVTAANQAAGVRSALPWLATANLLAEPAGKNTAAALGLAAVYLCERDADAVMAALPADHHIADEAAFAQVLQSAFAVAEASDVIVTIGIAPSRPETGFGYLELGAARDDGAREVVRFVEKPDAATAERYLAAGNYLWNGGMFIVRASRLLGEIERHMPETHAGLQSIRTALRERGAAAAAEVTTVVYPALPSVSIDYGVMERAADVVTLPGRFGWNDVGAWTALADYRPADRGGNVTVGRVVIHDAERNIVVADGDNLTAVVGVSDLVVVRDGNAVLVLPRERAQDVREVVAELQRRKLDEYL